MDSNLSFKDHFDSILFSKLEVLESKRKNIIRYVIIAKILNVLTLTVFFSMFLGFLSAFPFKDFEMGFGMFLFEGFFYFVLSLVVFGVFKKGINYVLEVKGYKKLLKNKPAINVITILFAALCMYGAWFLGKKFLGGELTNLRFFVRYFIAFGVMMLLGLFAFLFQQFEEKFDSQFKADIVPEILKFFDNNLLYDPSLFIKQNSFELSGLFRHVEIFDYKGSDYVMGNFGKGNFEFSQLNITQRTTSGSGSKSETKIENLFKGIFYMATFPKQLSGTTMIYPDYARRALDIQLGEKLNRAMEYDNYQLVTLEDVEFEKEFVVYSTDQVEARFILSPVMIEQIKSLQSKFEKDICLSFVDNKIFLAIADDYDLLSPIIFNRINEFKTVEPIYKLIGALCEIPGELKLKIK